RLHLWFQRCRQCLLTQAHSLAIESGTYKLDDRAYSPPARAKPLPVLPGRGLELERNVVGVNAAIRQIAVGVVLRLGRIVEGSLSERFFRDRLGRSGLHSRGLPESLNERVADCFQLEVGLFEAFFKFESTHTVIVAFTLGLVKLRAKVGVLGFKPGSSIGLGLRLNQLSLCRVPLIPHLSQGLVKSFVSVAKPIGIRLKAAHCLAEHINVCLKLA